ncbi:hypothetical protein KSS87_010039 [Heliosperma pusillum]|nr:hypothetical protein KSS87_020971 [Heliosperma pusillum]KAH9619050.1 hypothetical protein KSS87_010039 [Heliosperma pusillum]
MAVSINSVLTFNPGTRFCVGSLSTKTTLVSLPLLLLNSKRFTKCNRRISHVLAAESDRVTAERSESSSLGNPDSASADSVEPTTPTELESKISPPDDAKPIQKKGPLTARERLRAARVLSRYSEPKTAKSEMGRSVLDALRESEKGKKGLPQAPTNMLDDQKRGMPKAGLTFDFPGGNDLLVIVFSFVFISTVMFATTYFVWKVGAIHFNEN